MPAGLIACFLFLWNAGLPPTEADAGKTAPVIRLMTLELQLGGITLYKTDFPIHSAQSGPAVEKPQKTISFLFNPKNAIVWMRGSGVLVTPVKTKADQEIEGFVQIWPPPQNSGRFTIGLSFYSEGKTLLHTIHIARPKKRDRSTIATAGIVILTYPAKIR